MRFLCALLLLSVSSCIHLRPFKQIKSLHFTDDFSAKKSHGIVKGKDCKYSAGTYSTKGEVSYSKALEEARDKKGGLSYMTDVRLDSDDVGVTGLGGKECIIVKGKGHK